MVDTRKTARVLYLEHVISVHGQTPTSAPSFDHSWDHGHGDWSHESGDWFTFEDHDQPPAAGYERSR